MSLWEELSIAPVVRSLESPLRGWSSRTTVVSLTSGKLLVVNPCRSVRIEARCELAHWGRVSHLLAPNHFHHMGLRNWLAWYDDAVVIAAETALPRLQQQGVAACQARPTLDTFLPAGGRWLEPAGTRSGELWLSVGTPSGRCWIVGDAFFNVPQTPPGLAGRFLARSGTVPGLRIGNTFLRFALRDRAAYRSWLLDALADEQPQLLVPAHGQVSCGYDLPQRLAALVEVRV